MKKIYPNYNKSIVNFSSSIRKYYKLNYHYNTIEELDEVLEKEYKNVIMILLDGLGSNIIDKVIGSESFFGRHKVTDFTSVYPSTTATAVTSYLSSKSPIEHGWLGWHMYFKELDEDVVLFNNMSFYENKKINEKVEEYISYNLLFDEIKEKGISTFAVKPPVKEPYERDITYQVNKVIDYLSSSDERKFIYVYNYDPDHTMHEYGVCSNESRSKIMSLEKEIERLYSQINEDTLIIVCADHGMIDVEDFNLLDYPELTSLLIRKPTLEYRACSFYVEKEKKELFEKEFNKLFGKYFLLLTKEEIYNQKIFGYGKPHKLADGFIGDFVALAIDKYMLTYRTDNSGEVMKSAHGGLVEDEMVVPLIILKK